MAMHLTPVPTVYSSLKQGRKCSHTLYVGSTRVKCIAH